MNSAMCTSPPYLTVKEFCLSSPLLLSKRPQGSKRGMCFPIFLAPADSTIQETVQDFATYFEALKEVIIMWYIEKFLCGTADSLVKKINDRQENDGAGVERAFS